MRQIYELFSTKKEHEGIYNMPIGFAPLLQSLCSPFASVYGNAMVPIVFLY